MLLSTSSSSLTEQLTVSLAERIQTQLLALGIQPALGAPIRRGVMVRNSYPADPHAGHASGN